MPGEVKLTELEREIAVRVMRGEDPWGDLSHGGGSRRVSQAIGRLQRKGVMVRDLGDGKWVLTELGRSLMNH